MAKERQLHRVKIGLDVAGFLGPVLVMCWILRQLASPVRLKPGVLASEIYAALITVFCLQVVVWIGRYVVNVLRK